MLGLLVVPGVKEPPNVGELSYPREDVAQGYPLPKAIRAKPAGGRVKEALHRLDGAHGPRPEDIFKIFERDGGLVFFPANLHQGRLPGRIIGDDLELPSFWSEPRFPAGFI